MSRGRGPRGGCPPPEGVDVGYPLGHDHLQAYLDEFAFRFNRRRTPMAAFQTLLGLASSVHGPTTYDMLYRSESTR